MYIEIDFEALVYLAMTLRQILILELSMAFSLKESTMGGNLLTVQCMKIMSYFLFFDHCFRQFRGLKGQQMQYILKIYQCGSTGMPPYQPYQNFI